MAEILSVEVNSFFQESAGIKDRVIFPSIKGKEMGYLLSGKLQPKMKKVFHTVNPGDLICLFSEMPTQRGNPDPGEAKFLWLKVH